MGYPDGVKGYRIWSVEEKKCIISRDVVFQESTLTGESEATEPLEKQAPSEEFQLEVELESKQTDPDVNEDQGGE